MPLLQIVLPEQALVLILTSERRLIFDRGINMGTSDQPNIDYPYIVLMNVLSTYPPSISHDSFMGSVYKLKKKS